MLLRRLKRRHITDILFYVGVAFLIIGTIDLVYVSNHSEQTTTRQSSSQESFNPRLHSNGGPRSLQSITEEHKCRKTFSSSNLVADSKGYTCPRKALLSSQCCDTNHKETLRYTCATCDVSLCCTRLEYCVSCCLSPIHTQIRALLPKRHLLKRYVLDSPFSVCVAACRSGSRSVIHENAYRAEQHHCFGEQPPRVDARLYEGLFDFAAPLRKRNPKSSYSNLIDG